MHVGLIPDGNRRFMKQQGIAKLMDSYRMGISRFYDFMEWCCELGVEEITIYALSTENLKNRSGPEIEILFRVFADQAVKAKTDERLEKNDVRVFVCGDMDYLRDKSPRSELAEVLIGNLKKLEEQTKQYKKMKLNLAIAYGGRQDILNAAKKVCDSGQEFNEENIKKHLWIPSYPEIVIRTSENRLSNFLLWQAAYAEVYFVDKLWQEFERGDLEEIISNYRKSERRFGR